MSKTVTISPSSLNAVDVFNSCIVYTIPVHITYSTANSFLHTHTPSDAVPCERRNPSRTGGGIRHMFIYFKLPPLPLSFPIYSLYNALKTLMLNDDEIYSHCVLLYCAPSTLSFKRSELNETLKKII